jgi:hypothetical protein
MSGCNPALDRNAKSGSVRFEEASIGSTNETIQDLGEFFGRDPDPGVGHIDQRLV